MVTAVYPSQCFQINISPFSSKELKAQEKTYHSRYTVVISSVDGVNDLTWEQM